MHDVVSERPCDLLLELLDPLGMKLDHVTRIEVDQMIVMLAGRRLEA